MKIVLLATLIAGAVLLGLVYKLRPLVKTYLMYNMLFVLEFLARLMIAFPLGVGLLYVGFTIARMIDTP